MHTPESIPIHWRYTYKNNKQNSARTAGTHASIVYIRVHQAIKIALNKVGSQEMHEVQRLTLTSVLDI